MIVRWPPTKPGTLWHRNNGSKTGLFNLTISQTFDFLFTPKLRSRTWWMHCARLLWSALASNQNWSGACSVRRRVKRAALPELELAHIVVQTPMEPWVLRPCLSRTVYFFLSVCSAWDVAPLWTEMSFLLTDVPVESLRLRFALLQSLNNTLENFFLPLVELRQTQTYRNSIAALLCDAKGEQGRSSHVSITKWWTYYCA